MLGKEDERFEEYVEKLPHERVLPVEGAVKPLNDQLAEKELHLVVVCILCELPGEQHLADSLNGDLPENSVLGYHVVLHDDPLELQGGLLVHPVNDQGVDRGFQGDDLLSEVVLLDILGQDRLEDFTIVLEQLLVQETQKPDALDCKKHVVSVLRLDRRPDQGLAYGYQILVVDIRPALLEEYEA